MLQILLHFACHARHHDDKMAPQLASHSYGTLALLNTRSCHAPKPALCACISLSMLQLLCLWYLAGRHGQPAYPSSPMRWPACTHVASGALLNPLVSDCITPLACRCWQSFTASSSPPKAAPTTAPKPSPPSPPHQRFHCSQPGLQCRQGCCHPGSAADADAGHSNQRDPERSVSAMLLPTCLHCLPACLHALLVCSL